MVQPYFIFNGKDSREMGVVVETLPTIQRPKRKVTRYDVTGRDGALEVDEGGYDGYTTTMKINAFGQKLETLNAWLDGDGWFITSDEPDRQLWVVMDAQLKGTRYNVSGACYDSITITLYIHPWRYIIPADASTEYTEFPIAITNPYAWESRPKITIEGSGEITLTVNANMMTLNDITDGIIIDSELMDCMNLTKTALMNSHANIDEFPTFQPGGNTISVSGTVTKITVEPRWRVL